MLQLVCALLLFAQQMGLSHAIWHAAQQRPAHEQGAGSAQHDDHSSQGSRDASSLCELDAVLGQVLGGAALAYPPFSAEKPDAQAPLHALVVNLTTHTLTPRSRGPPLPS
ncbi:MAG TPA: hypothetical protein VFI62_15350 [Burkholderiales bacterium]|nr:hypothetical protein [Burkholderiales bacterium]